MMTPSLPDLPAILIEPIVRAALLEDLGLAGDLTTQAVVPAEARFTGTIAARQPGVVAGIAAARLAFALLDPAVETTVLRGDGAARRQPAGQQFAAGSAGDGRRDRRSGPRAAGGAAPAGLAGAGPAWRARRSGGNPPADGPRRRRGA